MLVEHFCTNLSSDHLIICWPSKKKFSVDYSYLLIDNIGPAFKDKKIKNLLSVRNKFASSKRISKSYGKIVVFTEKENNLNSQKKQKMSLNPHYTRNNILVLEKRKILLHYLQWKMTIRGCIRKSKTKMKLLCPNMEKTLALVHGHKNHSKWQKHKGGKCL